MKKAVIFYKNTDNIGDDVQTYGAWQLLGGADYFLDRESLHNPDIDENVKLLCNGWFMKNPENWPPHKDLDPLFISMYIDHKHGCYEKMLSPDLIPYYQKYAPIGCRDKNTLKLFKKLGVDSYYSGCATLTLPKYTGERTEEILLVDPFVKIFDKKYTDTQIERLIPEKYKNKVSLITHHDFEMKHLPIEERMKNVEKLLERYAKAKLIITSRIHCALPATAMGTPVYFMDVGYDRKQAHDRLEGLLDLFEVVDDTHFPVSSNQPLTKIQRKLGLYSKSAIKENPIDFDLKPETMKKFENNFKNASLLADGIRLKVKEFFDEN